MIYGWSPTIGDPTAYGWLTVAAYFYASWLCWRDWRASEAPPGAGGVTILRSRAQRRFWLTLALILLALGINKQLDLQSLFTAVGREVAIRQGWYGERRGVQREFIAGVALLGLAGGIALPLMARRAGGWAMMAAAGLVALIAFVVIRAASFHEIDAIIHSGWAGVKVNHVMELGGIAIIAAAALGFRRCVGRERPGARRFRR